MPPTRTGSPRQGPPLADITADQGCSVAHDGTAPPAWSAPARRPPRWGDLWRVTVARAHEAAQARRARVLAHDDLRAALCLPPLAYERPEQWSGYVPPQTWPRRHGDGLNASPRRVALVDIAAEAFRREQEPATLSEVS